MENKELDLLLRQVKTGDKKAFEKFYAATKKGVFSFLYSYLPDVDLCNGLIVDVYIKIKDNISKYNDGTNASAWMFQIAKNIALNNIKKSKREQAQDFVEDEYLTAYEEPELNMNSILHMIHEALNQKEEQIVLLHLVDGYKHKEIADIVNEPLGTVLWRYKMAIEKLQKVFGDYQ